MSGTIDPELVKQARWAPTFTIKPGNIKLFRRVTGVFTGPERKPFPGVVHHDLQLGGRDVRLHEPADRSTMTEPSPALLWIHGGGLILGTNDQNRVAGSLVVDVGMPVVAASYRLAPEHPFPAALDDLVATYTAFVAEADRWGVDRDRIAVGGASAGGGLAAALAQRLTDEGRPPAAQLLVYPMLDDRTCTRTDIGDTEHKVWNNVSNTTGWASYLGQPPGLTEVPPYAVPGRRENLAGLPPAWIGVGTADLFHDEDLAYAERLEAAGVRCDLMVVPGAVHGFDLLGNGYKLDASARWRKAQADFLTDVLFGGRPRPAGGDPFASESEADLVVTRQFSLPGERDELWQLVGDGWGQVDRWFSLAETSTVIDGPVVDGAPVSGRSLTGPGPAPDVVERLIRWEPTTYTLAYEVEAPKVPLTRRQVFTWRLSQGSGGRTTVTISMATDLDSGTAAQLAKPVFKQVGNGLLATMEKDLKRWAGGS